MRLPSPGAMIRTLLLAALVLPLTAMGCATAQSTPGDDDVSTDADVQTPVMDEPFRLGVGETARVDGHTVRFVAVAEDSRCPEGVQCIRAGEAKIRVEANSEPVELTIPNGMMRDGETSDVRMGALTLTVTDLTPYPGSDAAEAGDPVQAVLVVRP